MGVADAGGEVMLPAGGVAAGMVAVLAGGVLVACGQSGVSEGSGTGVCVGPGGSV